MGNTDSHEVRHCKQRCESSQSTNTNILSLFLPLLPIISPLLIPIALGISYHTYDPSFLTDLRTARQWLKVPYKRQKTRLEDWTWPEVSGFLYALIERLPGRKVSSFGHWDWELVVNVMRRCYGMDVEVEDLRGVYQSVRKEVLRLHPQDQGEEKLGSAAIGAEMRVFHHLVCVPFAEYNGLSFTSPPTAETVEPICLREFPGAGDEDEDEGSDTDTILTPPSPTATADREDTPSIESLWRDTVIYTPRTSTAESVRDQRHNRGKHDSIIGDNIQLRLRDAIGIINSSYRECRLEALDVMGSPMDASVLVALGEGRLRDQWLRRKIGLAREREGREKKERRVDG